MRKIALFAVAGLLGTSCHFFTKKTATDVKIAEVNGAVLYRSDVNAIFSPGITAADSLALLRNYVNNWARKQLVAAQAEEFLSKEQKDVRRELEDYRLSLLIYRYEKMYLEQRMDTVITAEQMKKTYDESPQHFILDKTIARVGLAQVPEDTLLNRRLRALYRSKRPEDRREIADICADRAGRYHNFDGQWIDAATLAGVLPLETAQIERDWHRGYLYLSSGGSEYFATVYELAKAGDSAPMDYERHTIAEVIRNKRKQDVLKSLENEIFNDALNRNQLKLYIDN